MLSAPKFRLKGQGWYETDFKTGDKRNIAGDSDKPAKSGDGEAAKKESKSSSDTSATSAAKEPSDSKASPT